MAKINQEFGAKVRSLLDEQRLSLRAASFQAAEHGFDISFTTIREMAAGIVPQQPRLIVGFALAVGADPDEMLALAAEPFKYDWEAHQRRRNAEQAASRRMVEDQHSPQDGERHRPPRGADEENAPSGRWGQASMRPGSLVPAL